MAAQHGCPPREHRGNLRILHADGGLGREWARYWRSGWRCSSFCTSRGHGPSNVLLGGDSLLQVVDSTTPCSSHPSMSTEAVAKDASVRPGNFFVKNDIHNLICGITFACLAIGLCLILGGCMYKYNPSVHTIRAQQNVALHYLVLLVHNYFMQYD